MKKTGYKGRNFFDIQDKAREENVKKSTNKMFRIVEWVKMKEVNPYLFTRDLDKLVTEEEFDKLYEEVK